MFKLQGGIDFGLPMSAPKEPGFLKHIQDLNIGYLSLSSPRSKIQGPNTLGLRWTEELPVWTFFL